MAAVQATGYSKQHSFTEAFQEAVQKLEQATGGPKNFSRVTVVEIGGEYGGVVGASHLFVTVQESDLIP